MATILMKFKAEVTAVLKAEMTMIHGVLEGAEEGEAGGRGGDGGDKGLKTCL